MAISSSYCSSFGGIHDTAKKLGLGEHLDFCLSRKELTANGPRLYTNDLLDIEMKTILQGRDILESMNFYIKYNFVLENILWLVCLDQLSFLQYLRKIKTRNFVVCKR